MSSSSVVHNTPLDFEQGYPLYSQEFADNPYTVYDRMRQRYGSLVPVELAEGVPATMVIGYRTAVGIMHDPAHFPVDARTWQQKLPADHELRAMMEWRPNALRTDGEEHQRYRAANRDAINAIDINELCDRIELLAVELVKEIWAGDEDPRITPVDLLSRYLYPLVSQILGSMLEFDADTAEKVRVGMAALFDAGSDAGDGNALLMGALFEHIERKRQCPGTGITTSLLFHQAELNFEEVAHQLATLYGAVSEPLVHLSANGLLLMLTDDRFGGGLLGGSLSTRDALDMVLFDNPPMAQFCFSYPRRSILLEDTWLPAHQPVVISLAACNADPAIRAADLTGNRSHLGFGLGPHACPAQGHALAIAGACVDQLLDVVPDIRLAENSEQLQWRPGPFNRALQALPVYFQ